MEKIILFGISDFAELAHYYLTNDSDYEVVAFSVSKEFMGDKVEFKGLPIVDFDHVEEKFPPKDYKFFAPMSPAKMNQLRENIYNSIKSKGYQMISYVSSKAVTFDNKIGENCFILENNVIQPFTSIGNNVVLWSGNHIGHHGEIKDHVMFTSHVVLSGHCLVKNNCFLGVNSTIRDGITLEEGTLVGMSSSIIRNTKEWSVYIGNPAQLREGKKSNELM